LMIYPVIVGTNFVNPSSVTHDNHYPMLRFKSLICLIKIRCKKQKRRCCLLLIRQFQ
jgi:hypothetical protein